MKFMRQPFDMTTDALHPASPPLRENRAGPWRNARPLAVVVAWDPTARAKRLLWGGLIGMLLCSLGFAGLNTFAERTLFMELGMLVIVSYLMFAIAGLFSAWYFLKGFWRYLFPRMGA